MAEKGKRRRSFKEGDVIAIALPGGRLCFSRALKSPLMAFYDLAATTVPPIDQIVACPILFKIWVMRLKPANWTLVGNWPLTEGLLKPTDFYKRDPISARLTRYREGEEVAATREECLQLENAAVWSAEHVEERLLAHIEGRPSIWVETLRCK